MFLEAEGERPVARFHPQIDVRAAGDLLTRAGFALPVADVEAPAVRYSSMFSLLARLARHGRDQLAAGPPAAHPHHARPRRRGTSPDAPTRTASTAERFEIVYLTGWAPDASQPRPARRGSATASLAEALKGKR